MNNQLIRIQSNRLTQEQINSRNFEKFYEVFIDAFSGATGGFCASLVLYPIENFRTRVQALTKEMQNQDSIFKEEFKDEMRGPSSPDHQTEFSTLNYFKTLLKNEGILTFYKGLGTGLIGTVCSFGIYFWWYRFFKNVFYHVLKRKELSDLDISIITMLSGILNTSMTNPIWFVNCRMAISKEKKSILKTVQDIYNAEGLSAFYKGALPNMVLVTNPIINFVIYENLKKLLLKNKFTLNAFQLLVISSIAKTAATIFTYPVLTVKIKMQANTAHRKVGMIKFILGIIKEIGLQGLYMGFYAKLIQTVLYNGFLMITYERLKRLIKFLLLEYLKRRKIIKDELIN